MTSGHLLTHDTIHFYLAQSHKIIHINRGKIAITLYSLVEAGVVVADKEREECVNSISYLAVFIIIQI